MKSATPLLSILFLSGFVAPAAFGAEPTMKTSPLRLRGADLPKGWTTLPAGVEDEQTSQLKQAFALATKGKEGMWLDVQGIDAGGEKVNIVFIGYPDEEKRKEWGGLVSFLFAKQAPKSYGAEQAMVMTENRKLSDLLQNRIARRHAFFRIAEVENLVDEGRDADAARRLEELVKELPEVAEVFLRVGDLYQFHLRPPAPKKALETYRRCLDLHAKEPMDAVLEGFAGFGAGRAHGALVQWKEAAQALERGAEACRDVARRLAARIRMEQARAYASLDDEDGCYAALEDAFALEASLGFSTAAEDARGDPMLEAMMKKSRISSLVSRSARTKPLDAIPGPGAEDFELAREPIVILPVCIENNRNPAAGLEEELEGALRSRMRGAGTFGVDYKGWGGPPVRWTALSLGRAAWEGVEQLGCFDLRLVGGTWDRGAGAEQAAFAADEARKKGMAPRVPARMFVAHLRMNDDRRRTDFSVTCAVVEETGAVLGITHFERACASNQTHQRKEMARIALEACKRLSKIFG